MRRSVLLGLVIVLLATGLACSSLPLGGGGNGGGASTGGVDIEIVNRSPDDVCYVLISPSSDDSWGDDRLGGDEMIGPGDRRTFNMDDDTYDVRVEDCGEAAMATAWEVSADTTVTVGRSGADRRLLLVNDSDAEICYVLISPSSGSEWGDDWMGDMESVPPGNSRIFYVEADTYDLQVLSCDEDVLVEEYEVDLTEDLTWTIGD